MKKTKLVALLLVLALMLNMIMPLMTVIAVSSYTITFTATGTHTLEKDGNQLKIDGEYVVPEVGPSQVWSHTVDVAADNKSATITIDTPATLNYNANEKFKLYNVDGHTPYNMGTEISSNTEFNVEDYENASEKSNIEFNGATSVVGTATEMKVNYTNGKIIVTGANMSSSINNNNNKITISTTSSGNITFEAVGNTGYTGTILENGEAKSNPYTLNVQLNANYNIDAEFTESSTHDSTTNANITVSAGSGSYVLRGNNVNYDNEVEISINGSRWDHSNTIQYNTDNSDTTVTFTFETLWINRFYDNIVINGVPYNVSDYLDFDDRTEWLIANHGTQALAFDIPNVAKADSYNVVVKHGENNGSKYLATFLWTADPNQAGSHDYIGHSTLEFVKAVYTVGNTKYTVTEKDLEGRLQREGGFMCASSDDGFLSYGVVADVDYDDGNLTLPGNAQITMRVVPDYGYQVTSVNGENNFTTTDAGVSEFTVTVAGGTAGYFQATVEKVDNTVTPTSEKVKSGNIALGDSASTDIKNGTVRLSVEDVELSSDKITNFEEKASEAGDYTITNYLDINLDKVLYKGTADDVWSEQIHHLTDKALITLQLEEGVDASNIVIVHNIDNGDEFEIIPIESYDAETNTISFYTNSFSNYAIANKTSAITENTKTTDISSNPTTGDNIIMIISIFAIATFGVFTTLKVNKNRRIRKH